MGNRLLMRFTVYGISIRHRMNLNKHMRYRNLQFYVREELEGMEIAFQNMLINVLLDTWFVNRVVRPFLVRRLGGQCGGAVTLRRGGYYGNMKNLRIKHHTCINREVFFDAYDTITIGSHVGIGFRVILNTSTHEMGPSNERVGTVTGSPIVVEDGVWIGAGAYIGPGVTLGRGCVVSAGAVVMRSVEPNVVVTGSPARVIQRLVGEEERIVSKLESCHAR
jgi:maltose O-acetyltransferase